uniref:Rab-GAP TBC domain-containing protein n=1 Tax=Oryctolagus cuniculus TaxID=9986 RepID=G1U0S9_RABIT
MEAVKSQLPQKQDVIISKYEQGCQGRAQVARPEEEDINTRPFINYLGILQEKMLPQDRALEAKHRHQEAQRVEKWVKMMKHWTQYQSSKKMESQVYKGIPLPMRGKVWSFLLDVDKVKAENPGKYQQMKGQGKLLSEHIHQIDADVRRTFRNHVMFRQRYGMKQQALFHVLLAHSEFDVEVGYRQGMNWVAAVLLMFLDEEDAFWALTQLMRKPRHAMHGRWPGTAGTHLLSNPIWLHGVQDNLSPEGPIGASPEGVLSAMMAFHQPKALQPCCHSPLCPMPTALRSLLVPGTPPSLLPIRALSLKPEDTRWELLSSWFTRPDSWPQGTAVFHPIPIGITQHPSATWPCMVPPAVCTHFLLLLLCPSSVSSG